MSDANKLVKVYVKMRDARDEARREADTKIAEIEEQMGMVEQALLELCKTTGQDGGKTEYGSVTRTVKTRYWTSNWPTMYDFIKTHDAVELLEQRIHQGNFKQFLQENPDLLPEGVNVDSRYAITVRRSK